MTALQRKFELSACSAHIRLTVTAHIGCSTPIDKVSHGAEQDPWQAVASALGAARHELLLWEKVGRVVHTPKLPGYQAQNKPQPLLVSTLSLILPGAVCYLAEPPCLSCLLSLHDAVIAMTVF